MKKGAFHFCFLCLLVLLFSCGQSFHSGRTSFSVSESGNMYTIKAEYPEQNTRRVEKYLDNQLGDEDLPSFVNSNIDAELTFHDGSKIYMKNQPGDLRIELNKDQNSTSSYQKIKEVGEGLKAVLNNK